MTPEETKSLRPLVGQQVTLITHKESVYVGVLACMPHHGKLLLKELMIFNKNGLFKASSGSARQNARLFNLRSIKSISKTVLFFDKDNPASSGILPVVRLPDV